MVEIPSFLTSTSSYTDPDTPHLFVAAFRSIADRRFGVSTCAHTRTPNAPSVAAAGFFSDLSRTAGTNRGRPLMTAVYDKNFSPDRRPAT